MAAPKRTREKDADPGERGRGSSDEALQLVDAMREHVEVLVDFLESEEKAARRRAVPPKRLARLRLVSDDLRSARKFAAKAVKG